MVRVIIILANVKKIGNKAVFSLTLVNVFLYNNAIIYHQQIVSEWFETGIVSFVNFSWRLRWYFSNFILSEEYVAVYHLLPEYLFVKQPQFHSCKEFVYTCVNLISIFKTNGFENWKKKKKKVQSFNKPHIAITSFYDGS